MTFSPIVSDYSYCAQVRTVITVANQTFVLGKYGLFEDVIYGYVKRAARDRKPFHSINTLFIIEPVVNEKCLTIRFADHTARYEFTILFYS